MSNMHAGSDGKRYSESMIRRRYSISLHDKHEGEPFPRVCKACEKRNAVHNDHTISQKRCKQIHKTDLIWDPRNFEDSCAICHGQWEAIKNGDWINHKNLESRLRFLKEHDPEGFEIRINLVSLSLQQQCHIQSMNL